jgi:hypothetical protein
VFKQSNTLLKADTAFLVASSALMVFVSMLRAYWAESIMVDTHAVTGAKAFTVYMLFCGSLAVYCRAYFKLWTRGIDRKKVRQLSYLMAGIFTFMLPMLSNDVFSLITYGDLANQGVNIFAEAKLNGSSFFLPYCNPNGNDGPNVYGPVCIDLMRLATYFFPINLLGALLAFKIIVFIWSLLFIEAGFKIAGLFDGGEKAFLFIALNPVFLIEGVGQQHVDLLASALALWAIYFLLGNKIEIAFIAVGLAIGVKMSYILLLPYGLVALYLQLNNLQNFLIQSLVGVACVILILILVYWPYFTSLNHLWLPFQSLYHQVPTKSIVEVFGDIIFYAVQFFHQGGASHASGYMVADSVLVEQKQHIYQVLIVVCRVVALATSVLLIFGFFQKREDKLALTSLYLRLLLLFLLFYSHVIYPWYLLLALPFAWFEKDERFMVWLFVLTCFCNAQGIMCSVDRGSWVYALVVPLIAINVFIFLWRFRANFMPNKNP